ncbi:LysE/ArgO family amino acid transporter [Hahella sp. HN01]|uniref:LysE/ArgO family amino acid transporter n=1 Tax=Hahella sp. HN01 TaxID=2847262 RepID=UPI001C1EA4C3|nr:LysE/ArgO family amino acid transporter [Hahella sp. HN01]MBU6954866.1 LysE/ArgO family amino acid transporter [Hahella sp. HN01]
MWQSYFNGFSLSLGIIVAIGAQNAFVLAQSLKREHHFPVAAICALADLVLIAAGVFGMAALLREFPQIAEWARWGGMIFLSAYGAFSVKRAFYPGPGLEAEGAVKRNLGIVVATTLAVTLLNPHVYLDTLFLIGSVGAQQSAPAAYAAGAASASIIWFFGLAIAAAALSPWLSRPSFWRLVDGLIAVLMWRIAWGLFQNGA